MSKVIEITDALFEEEVFNTEQPVLVYFWASWCGPCKLVSPTISLVAQTYGDRLKVVKLEADPNPNARSKCKVEGLPAIRLFKDKELLESSEGAITKEKLETLLNSHLN